MATGHPAKSGCPFLYTILPIGEPNRRFSVQLLPIGESNRRFSVQTPSVRSIGHALAAWQTGILQSRGAYFCMLSFQSESLIAGSASSPLQPQHRPSACRIAIGHPAKSGCLILYAILPIGESNHRFSVQTPSVRSIGHALIAWQSGILQSQSACFCMLSFRSGSLIACSAYRPFRLGNLIAGSVSRPPQTAA